MRKLMTILMAGVFVALSAVAVQADCGALHEAEQLSAIDSYGYTIVTVAHSNSDILASAGDVVTLDSSGLWTASVVSESASDSVMMNAESSGSTSSNMYCFDSANRFCALAF